MEFRVFLRFLKKYFEYFEAFRRIDFNGNKRISIKEWLEAEFMIEKWIGEYNYVTNLQQEFRAIDKNQNGFIIFSQFADWADRKHLDIQVEIDKDKYDRIIRKLKESKKLNPSQKLIKKFFTANIAKIREIFDQMTTVENLGQLNIGNYQEFLRKVFD